MVQDLCNIFSDCGVAKLPTVYNIQQIILAAAKKVIIQKACFTLKSNQTELGEFLKPVTLSEIEYLSSFLSATKHESLALYNLELLLHQLYNS